MDGNFVPNTFVRVEDVHAMQQEKNEDLSGLQKEDGENYEKVDNIPSQPNDAYGDEDDAAVVDQVDMVDGDVSSGSAEIGAVVDPGLQAPAVTAQDN